jgi:hypothetical protein
MRSKMRVNSLARFRGARFVPLFWTALIASDAHKCRLPSQTVFGGLDMVG